MAENNNQQVDNIPLAPAKIYGRSDEEFAAPKPKLEKKSNKCLVYFLVLVLIVSVLIFIFANAVLRVEAPQVTLNSVSIKHLSNLTASSTASLNVSLVTEIDIDNKNYGYFKYENSSVAILCENVTVGIAKVNGGCVAARSTGRLNVTVVVTSNDALRENPEYTSDLSSGVLELRSYAEVVGRIHVMKILNKRRSNLMNCTMALNLTSKAIQDLRCE